MYLTLVVFFCKIRRLHSKTDSEEHPARSAIASDNNNDDDDDDDVCTAQSATIGLHRHLFVVSLPGSGQLAQTQ